MVLFIFMRFHINIPGPGTETGMLASGIPVRVDMMAFDIFEIRDLFPNDKVQRSQFGGIGKYG